MPIFYARICINIDTCVYWHLKYTQREIQQPAVGRGYYVRGQNSRTNTRVNTPPRQNLSRTTENAPRSTPRVAPPSTAQVAPPLVLQDSGSIGENSAQGDIIVNDQNRNSGNDFLVKMLEEMKEGLVTTMNEQFTQFQSALPSMVKDIVQASQTPAFNGMPPQQPILPTSNVFQFPMSQPGAPQGFQQSRY